MMLLKPCPFCWSAEIEVRKFFTDGPDHYVFCLTCSASGPLGETPAEAAGLWNSAIRESAERIAADPLAEAKVDE